jgi:hypothetical protein
VQLARIYFGNASRMQTEVVHFGPLAEYSYAPAALGINATR